MFGFHVPSQVELTHTSWPPLARGAHKELLQVFQMWSNASGEWNGNFADALAAQQSGGPAAGGISLQRLCSRSCSQWLPQGARSWRFISGQTWNFGSCYKICCASEGWPHVLWTYQLVVWYGMSSYRKSCGSSLLSGGQKRGQNAAKIGGGADGAQGQIFGRLEDDPYDPAFPEEGKHWRETWWIILVGI